MSLGQDTLDGAVEATDRGDTSFSPEAIADMRRLYVGRTPDRATPDIGLVDDPLATVEQQIEQGRDASAANPWDELYEQAPAGKRFSIFVEFVRSMTIIDLAHKFPTLAYAAIALSEEVGEFAEKVEMATIRGLHDQRLTATNVLRPELSEADRTALMLELGDVMFYIHLAYSDIHVFTYVEHSNDRTTFGREALKLCAATGRFDGAVKKLHRDGGAVMTTDRVSDLSVKLGVVYEMFRCCCDQIGVTIDEVAIANMRKIMSRLRRNVLAGSGDNR